MPQARPAMIDILLNKSLNNRPMENAMLVVSVLNILCATQVQQRIMLSNPEVLAIIDATRSPFRTSWFTSLCT